MKRLLIVALALFGSAVLCASAAGASDVLRISDASWEKGEWQVALHAFNERELAALDVPIRFGRPGDAIELIGVEFADRVADWDFTHAQIDNQAKTVILGLISELVGVRPNADMKVAAEGSSRIATFVFQMAEGTQPRFETFTTKSPGHALTFIYNDRQGERLTVRESAPEFEVDINFKTAVLPIAHALSQNFPNPFNPTTSFKLSLPEASDYEITIFNVAGQLVRAYEGHAEAGIHTITWDGRNRQGAQVASGVYFYRAEASGFRQTRRMVMLK